MANLKKRTNLRKKGNEKKEIKKGFLWPRTIYFLCVKYTHWVISGYLLLFVVIFKNVKKQKSNGIWMFDPSSNTEYSCHPFIKQIVVFDKSLVPKV